MMPPGFMPGTDANDAPTMQMCHGAGPLPQGTHTPVDGNGPAPDPSTHHESPCVFAAAGTAAPPSFTLPMLDGPLTPEAIPAPPEPAPVHRPQHRAHAPRAPPAFANPA